MNVGSLFSGIGGIDLGFQRAGFDIAWQVEIDPWCRQILAKHWPDVPKYEDITKVKGEAIKPVDVLAGGFPCQDVSVAGKQKGIEGERSGLWFEFARLIRELRPLYVFVENVPGLLVRGVDRVLGELAESGYDAEWDCIPASALGAPHRRDRVWIVAYPMQQSGAFGGHDPPTTGESRCGSIDRSRSRDNDRRIFALGEDETMADPQSSDDSSCETSGRGTPIQLRGGCSRKDVAHPESSGIDRQERLALDDGPESRGRHTDSRGSGADVRLQGDKRSATLAYPQRIYVEGDGASGEQESTVGQRNLSPEGRQQAISGWQYWAVEPDVGRVAHGVPRRVDRLRGLGNAVCPQVVEWIAKRIAAR